MGVNGLWKLLEPTAYPVQLESLRGKTLAIDASIWIYHFLKAMRDPSGRVMAAAHIVGFFRRICKLLFLEIRPVFVFDGKPPILKKMTTQRRSERRQGQEQTAKATANKLLAMQLQRAAVEQAEQKKKQKNNEKRGYIIEDMVPENERSDAGRPAKSPHPKTGTLVPSAFNPSSDQYSLPEIDAIGRNADDRFLDAEELDEYAKQFTSQARTGFIDTTLVDFKSPQFQSLPKETQYQLLNMARLKSRLRMGYNAEELAAMFPDHMDFSRFQIERVAQRNFFTQKLMNLVGFEEDLSRRISSEKNREYVLKRTNNGYVMSMDTEDNNENQNKSTEMQQSLSFRSASRTNSSQNISAQPVSSPSNNQIESANVPSTQLPNLESAEPLGTTSVVPDSDNSVDALFESEESEGSFEDIDLNPEEEHLTDDDEGPTKEFSLFENDTNELEKRLQDMPQWFSNSSLDVQGVQEIREPGILEQDWNHTDSSDDGDKKKVQIKNSHVTKESSQPRAELHQPVDQQSVEKDDQVAVQNEEKTELQVDDNDKPVELLNSSDREEVALETPNTQNTNATGIQIPDQVQPIMSEPSDEQNKVEEEVHLEENAEDKKDDEAEIIDEEESFSVEKGNPEKEIELDEKEIELAQEEAREEEEKNEDIASMLIAEAEDDARFAEKLAHDNSREWTQQDSQAFKERIDNLRKQFANQVRDSDTVTTEIIQDCQQLLQLFGIPYITAPSEAEAQCAELRQLKLVEGVVTDDGDTFLFDDDAKVYRNMFSQTKYVEYYTTARIKAQLGLDRLKLIDLAFLLGSDYTEGVVGIGPVNGVEILAEFDTLKEFAQWWRGVQLTGDENLLNTPLKRRIYKQFRTKLNLSDTFPSKEVVQAYLHPSVDADKTRFVWGIPDLDGLRTYMMKTAGWEVDNTDSMLLPVVQDIKRRNMHKKMGDAYRQSSLHDYYQAIQDPMLQSKRARKAAEIIREKRRK